MEVDDGPPDITSLKGGKASETLCNGDSAKVNGVNGPDSPPVLKRQDKHDNSEDDDNSNSSDNVSKPNGQVNGKDEHDSDKEEKGYNSDKEESGEEDDSIMEVDEDSNNDDRGKKSKESSSPKDSSDGTNNDEKDKSESKTTKDKDSEEISTTKEKEEKEGEDNKNESQDESSKDLSVKQSKVPSDDKKDEVGGKESKDATGDKQNLANLDPSLIETKAEAAARLKNEAASKAKFAVMDVQPEIMDMRPMAHLLHDIGMDMCREQVYSHLIKVQTKKQNHNKLTDREGEQLQKLKDAHVSIKQKNEAINVGAIKCAISNCSFKTESENVMEWHLEFAHGQDEDSYSCSFCSFATKMPGVFFFHMENEHKRKGRIYMKSANFSCPLCPFENNKRGTILKHRVRCEKVFSMRRNLEPSPTDCDIPLKKNKKMILAQQQQQAAKTRAAAAQQQQQQQLIMRAQQTKSNVRIQPAAAASPAVAQAISQAIRPGVQNSQASIALAAQAIAQQAAANVLSRQKPAQTPAIPLAGQIPGGMIPMYPPGTTQAQILAGTVRPTHYAIGNQLYQIVQARGQFMLQPVTTPNQPAKANSNIRPAPARPTGEQKAKMDLEAALEAARKNVERKQAEAKRNVGKNKAGGSPQFEICEICGGFVKDRDSLHIHFFWAHKVEINKEVFQQQQPHLICDICKSRFWTFQGLHRHRQITHGTGAKQMPKPTSAVKPGTPTYKCYMCQEQVAYLATHLSEKHNVSIQQMFKAKKCYVCGLNFDTQKTLEKHLVKNHRELLTPQKFKTTARAPFGSSPIPTGLYENTGKEKSFQPECSICDQVFKTLEEFSTHCNEHHIFKCYRCGDKWSSKELLQKHFYDDHRLEQEECPVCNTKVTIGRPMIRHMKNSHLKDVNITLTRLDAETVKKDNERWEERQKIWAQKKAEKLEEEIITLDDSDDESHQPPAKKPRVEKRTEEIVVNDDDDDDDKNDKKGEDDDDLQVGQEVIKVDGEEIVIENADEENNDDNNSSTNSSANSIAEQNDKADDQSMEVDNEVDKNKEVHKDKDKEDEEKEEENDQEEDEKEEENDQEEEKEDEATSKDKDKNQESEESFQSEKENSKIDESESNEQKTMKSDNDNNDSSEMDLENSMECGD